ncbi:MAG: DUF2029 domain-containing protein [Blastochloris sp.]|nr:DUF2029 domain-containing protein [Blastochloris sp.]
MLLIVSAAWLLHRHRPILGGLVLSCFFYKPQFLPLLLLFMLILGHGRLLIGSVLGGMFWAALSLLLCGWQSHLDWLAVLQRLDSGEHNQVVHLNQTLKMFLLNHLQAHGASDLLPWARPLSTLPGLLLMMATAFWLRQGSAGPFRHAGPQLLLGGALLTFCSPYLMHYDLLLAAGCCLLFYHAPTQARWWNNLALLLFWIISLLSINLAKWPRSAQCPLMFLYVGASLWMLSRFNQDSSAKSSNSTFEQSSPKANTAA